MSNPLPLTSGSIAKPDRHPTDLNPYPPYSINLPAPPDIHTLLQANAPMKLPLSLP